MKFEDIIKQKVEQHQEAYDPKAWEALSSKIGSSAAKVSSTLKWWMVAASVLVVGVGCIVYFNTGNQNIKPTEQIKEVNADNATSKTNNDKSNVNVTSEKIIAAEANEKETAPVKNSTEKIQKALENNNLTKDETVDNVKKTTVVRDESGVLNPKVETKIHVNWVAQICDNEVIELINDNDVAIKIENSENSHLISAHQSIQSSDLKAGIYKVKSKDGNVLQTLEIIHTQKLNFISEEIVFEKGLPFVPARITSNELSSYNWSLNGQQLSAKREVLIPAFDKGNVKIDFSGIENSCPINEVYNVVVREDYNLLAVNAFNVGSRDERNKTFLPFALYERDEAFEMQIIDPKTGEVIFKTNSVENPWNGIDNRTGELVAPNARYIWTVSLSRKADFETKGVYQGVIVRVVY